MALDQKISALADRVRSGSVKATAFASREFVETYQITKEGVSDDDGFFIAQRGKGGRAEYVLVCNSVEFEEPAGPIRDLFDAASGASSMHRVLDTFLALS